jgi:hypothetical protein
MMRALELVLAAGWGVFWLYWLAAAFSVKRGRIPWSRELRIRAVIVVVVIVLVRFGVLQGHGLNTDPARAGLGLVLFALGLGFAIWARVNIGRNWGTPMTQKDEPRVPALDQDAPSVHRLSRPGMVGYAALVGVSDAQGSQPAGWRAASDRSWSVSDVSSTRSTVSQRLCIGHLCMRREPSRTALNDTSGTHLVSNRLPCRHLTIAMDR